MGEVHKCGIKRSNIARVA